MRFPRGDTIAVMFCSTHKSLTLGQWSDEWEILEGKPPEETPTCYTCTSVYILSDFLLMWPVTTGLSPPIFTTQYHHKTYTGVYATQHNTLVLALNHALLCKDIKHVTKHFNLLQLLACSPKHNSNYAALKHLWSAATTSYITQCFLLLVGVPMVKMEIPSLTIDYSTVNLSSYPKLGDFLCHFYRRPWYFVAIEAAVMRE